MWQQQTAVSQAVLSEGKWQCHNRESQLAVQPHFHGESLAEELWGKLAPALDVIWICMEWLVVLKCFFFLHVLFIPIYGWLMDCYAWDWAYHHQSDLIPFLSVSKELLEWAIPSACVWSFLICSLLAKRKLALMTDAPSLAQWSAGKLEPGLQGWCPPVLGTGTANTARCRNKGMAGLHLSSLIQPVVFAGDHPWSMGNEGVP